MRALMMTLGRWSLWRVLLLAFAWLGIVVMTWRLVIAPWLFRRWSRDMEAILSRIAAEHPDQAIGAISLGVPPLFFIILLVPPVALLTAWCVARLGWTA